MGASLFKKLLLGAPIPYMHTMELRLFCRFRPLSQIEFRFLELPTFKNNLHFPWRFKISGFCCIIFIKCHRHAKGAKSNTDLSNAYFPTGLLHIQVQYTPDMGHAFIINSRLPLKKWLQIVMSVDDTTVHVTIRHFNGHVFEKEENAVHGE